MISITPLWASLPYFFIATSPLKIFTLSISFGLISFKASELLDILPSTTINGFVSSFLAIMNLIFELLWDIQVAEAGKILSVWWKTFFGLLYFPIKSISRSPYFPKSIFFPDPIIWRWELTASEVWSEFASGFSYILTTKEEKHIKT